KMSSIQFIPIPEGHPACALRKQRKADGLHRKLFPPGSAIMSRSKRARTDKSSPTSTAFQSNWERSARASWIARGTCALACHSHHLRPVDGTPTRRLINWCGGWPGAVFWNTASGVQEMTGTGSSSSRRSPTIGRECRGSATLTVSSSHGSRTCGGAGRRECGNRRAPEPCSRFAIRQSRRPSPYFLHHDKSDGSVGRTDSRGSSFSPCWWIAKSFSRSTPIATAVFDQPKVTTTSFFGTFTIFCFTRAARKADRPTRLVGSVYMRVLCLRFRRYGPAGPA